MIPGIEVGYAKHPSYYFWIIWINSKGILQYSDKMAVERIFTMQYLRKAK
jgi:hypothetical protein